MENFKETNKELYFRSRYEIWKKKEQLRQEEYFENKNAYKQKKLEIEEKLELDKELIEENNNATKNSKIYKKKKKNKDYKEENNKGTEDTEQTKEEEEEEEEREQKIISEQIEKVKKRKNKKFKIKQGKTIKISKRDGSLGPNHGRDDYLGNSNVSKMGSIYSRNQGVYNKLNRKMDVICQLQEAKEFFGYIKN